MCTLVGRVAILHTQRRRLLVEGHVAKDPFLTKPWTLLWFSFKELVVQKGWRLPEYMVTQESGPAHRKEFTMTCRVERFIEIGNGGKGGSFTFSLCHTVTPNTRWFFAWLCSVPASFALQVLAQLLPPCLSLVPAHLSPSYLAHQLLT